MMGYSLEGTERIGFFDLSLQEFIRRHRGLYLVFTCSFVVGLTCILDVMTGPQVSYDIFYLFPVILAAWWGNFSYGVLLALESCLVMTAVAHLEDPAAQPHALLVNGALRFCFFLLISNLVLRFKNSIYQERIRARTDPLTGAANGRVFYEILNNEIERFTRTARPFTLAYLDVDHFKKVNDQMGHTVGDQILKKLVETVLKNTRRQSDTIARLGGDEFALILPEMDSTHAVHVLEKLRDMLLKEMARNGWPVTFSIGAATFLNVAGDVDTLVQKVDALMYAVKRNGKNHIRHEIIRELGDSKEDCLPKVERRASIRVLCNRTIRIRIPGNQDESLFAKILDISNMGLLIHAESQLPVDTLVTIEPLCSPKLNVVLAKVVRVMKDQEGWLHGCELAQKMTFEDLQKWLK